MKEAEKTPVGKTKAELRAELVALSFSDKVKILEKLRERSLAIAPAREKLAAQRKQKCTSE